MRPDEQLTPEYVASLPVVAALQPVRLPYLARLSEHSGLMVWHVDVEFDEWVIPVDLQERWADKHRNAAETWSKRPLAVGVDSGAQYSCGEIEIVARLRQAGFESYWVSEWSGFSHLESWQPFCVKRNEFSERAPRFWRYDQEIRTQGGGESRGLGSAGGHPDVGAITPDGFFFLEYKGPNDSIKAKQNSWAAAVIEREAPRLAYVAVRGSFRKSAVAPRASTPTERKSAPKTLHPPSKPSTGPMTRADGDNETPVPQRASIGGKLHRRTISDTLKKERGWSIISHVDGTIDFSFPSRRAGAERFVDEVREAVEDLGYTPTVRIAKGSKGDSVVRVTTPETLAQAGAGAHRR